MITLYPFQQPLNGVFFFQPTLDGQPYIVSVPWGLGGQRPLVRCTQLNGTPVFLVPLIGSDAGVAIQNLTWNNGVATVTTASPHGYPIAAVLELSIQGVDATGYNGANLAFITGPSTYTFSLATDPGPVSDYGIASYDINMAAGYFQASTLVYRTSSGNFEVGP